MISFENGLTVKFYRISVTLGIVQNGPMTNVTNNKIPYSKPVIKFLPTFIALQRIRSVKLTPKRKLATLLQCFF